MLELPSVSVVLATRDRPRFLALALTCYQRQTYPRRELVVVDDGDRFPADGQLVEAAGGRLLRVPTGTPLGSKLNRGLEQMGGDLCQKMDDDDWYSPAFLETMIGNWIESRSKLCRPQVAYLAPILFFELAAWEIKRSTGKGTTGSTLLFAREEWERRPFRDIPTCEDLWFAFDHTRAGARLCPFVALETYLAVRHGGLTDDRDHAWTHKPDGRTVEQVLKTEPAHGKRPEDLLPTWAVERYREIRYELTRRPLVADPSPPGDPLGEMERRV